VLINAERDAIDSLRYHHSRHSTLKNVRAPNFKLPDGSTLLPLGISTRWRGDTNGHVLVLDLPAERTPNRPAPSLAELQECECAVLLREPTETELSTWQHKVQPSVFELLLLQSTGLKRTIFARTTCVQVWAQLTIT
jgi:hypothetical protein